MSEVLLTVSKDPADPSLRAVSLSEVMSLSGAISLSGKILLSDTMSFLGEMSLSGTSLSKSSESRHIAEDALDTLLVCPEVWECAVLRLASLTPDAIVD